MFSLLLPQMLLLGALAVLAAMLYGTAALWAAAGRAGWLQRVAPITLLLAALFPIGAYDLFALYLSQALSRSPSLGGPPGLQVFACCAAPA